METPLTNAPLEYSWQPPGSIAQVEWRSDGGVQITIPPILRRRLGKFVLGISLCGLVVGPPLLITAGRVPILEPNFKLVIGLGAVMIIGASCVTTIVTLWMGFRWTIIHASQEGLRLSLRGLLFRREWSIPRERIGSVKRRGALWVLDQHGLPIGRIDATTPSEEFWVMKTIARVLDVPISK